MSDTPPTLTPEQLAIVQRATDSLAAMVEEPDYYGDNREQRADNVRDYVERFVAEAYLAGVKAERERAAALAEGERVDADATGDDHDRAYNQACEDIAAAIRAGTPGEPAP